MRIQNNHSKRKRGTNEKYRCLIQSVLEDFSKKGEKHNQTQIIKKIKEKLQNAPLGSTFSKIKTPCRNTVHKMLEVFKWEGVVGKEGKQYYWILHYDKFQIWQKWITDLTIKLEEKYSLQPKEFFENNFILIIPDKDDSHYTIMVASVEGLWRNAPAMKKEYLMVRNIEKEYHSLQKEKHRDFKKEGIKFL